MVIHWPGCYGHGPAITFSNLMFQWFVEHFSGTPVLWCNMWLSFSFLHLWFVDDLMHFFRQSNLTMSIKHWLHPLCVTHIRHWCKKCDNVAATEISMLQISFHYNLLWSEEASIKKPTCNTSKPFNKKKKQTFNAEELKIWVVWDVTLCHPISNSCHRAVQWWQCDAAYHTPENCSYFAQCCSYIQELKPSSYSSNKCMFRTTRQAFVRKIVFTAEICASSLKLPSQSAYLIPHTMVLMSAITSGNTSSMAL